MPCINSENICQRFSLADKRECWLFNLLAGKNDGGSDQDAYRQKNKGYAPVDAPHIIKSEEERQDGPAQKSQRLQKARSRDAVVLNKAEEEAGLILAVMIFHRKMLEMVEKAAAQGMGNNVACVVAVILEPAAEKRVKNLEQEIYGTEIKDRPDRLAADSGVDGLFH